MSDAVVEVDTDYFESLPRNNPWLEYELELAQQGCHVSCYYRYETKHLTKEARKLLANYLSYKTGASI